MKYPIKILIGLVVIVAVVFAAMSLFPAKTSENGGEIVGENLEGEADPSRMTLGMTEWFWIRAQYNDGREVRPKQESAFALTFDDNGQFTAKTDCNHMGGNYEVGDGAITFSEIFTTLMYCEGSQESEFASFLTNAAAYHFTSRGELILDLKFDSGSVVFR